jgi:ATP-dependent helicase HrpB
MLALPLHPRLARVVAAAPTTTSCLLATVVDERDVLRGRVDELPADLGVRVALGAGQLDDQRADRGALRRLRDRSADLARRAGARFDLADVDIDAVGRLLLAGFPDRLAARRRRGQFQLRTGKSAFVAIDDPLAAADFVVAADLDGRRDRARIRLAAPVEAVDITSVLHDVAESRRLLWDSGRDDLVLRIERRLDALSIGEETRPPEPGDATVAALIDRVRATRLAVLDWTPAAVQLRARVASLAATMGGADVGWPDLSDRALLASLDTWLRPYLAGATGRDDLRRVGVTNLLRALLPPALGAELDTLAPEAWTLPVGRRVPIDYTADRPTVSVRVQDVFGVVDHPRVAGGRVPLTIALLSPADRPIQVTADLPGFWAGSWAAVRKDLAGRYPKHRWPADPAGERPTTVRRR